MTKPIKGKHAAGFNSGAKSTDRYLSPQRPYTGDGKRRRFLLDEIKVIFKKATDR
jgi:hypothetical protein